MKKTRRLQTQGEGPRMLALEPQMNLTHGLTPKRLRNILELADQGDILEQHLLFADMEDRCEHLAAEMGKRKRALLTLDWEILPGRANDARAARIAAAVREQFDAVNGFEDLLMDLASGTGFPPVRSSGTIGTGCIFPPPSISARKAGFRFCGKTGTSCVCGTASPTGKNSGLSAGSCIRTAPDPVGCRAAGCSARWRGRI